MAFAKEKIDAVKGYLQTKYPHCAVNDRFDYTRKAQEFRLVHNDEVHLVTVYSEFLDDYSAAEISRKLQDSQFDYFFQELHDERLIVSKKGVSLL